MATLHDRPVPFPARVNVVPVLDDGRGQLSSPSPTDALLAQITQPAPSSSIGEVDLGKILASLETKVTTMHEQLTQLALQLRETTPPAL